MQSYASRSSGARLVLGIQVRGRGRVGACLTCLTEVTEPLTLTALSLSLSLSHTHTAPLTRLQVLWATLAPPRPPHPRRRRASVPPSLVLPEQGSD